MSIVVKDLQKTYRIRVKQEGLLASLRALIQPEFKYVNAVDNVSFQIEQGELVGFVGANGAGKTTTLKMLSGILYPSGGSVEVLGFTPSERDRSYLRQISLVMGQKNQLWWDLTPMDGFSLLKEIYEVSDRDYKIRLGELLELLDLKDHVNQQLRQLSLGQRMKCELLAALLHQPKVLYLDEPTIGLDVVMQKKIREFIKEYNRKHKATIMLTSHYMDDVQEICDRIILIDKGRVLFDGRIDDLLGKYANYKTLIIITNEKLTREELKNYGEVVEYNLPRVVLNVPRHQASKVAGKLLAEQDIDDLDINAPDLEGVVHNLFAGK